MATPAQTRAAGIISALDAPEVNPLIGRPAGDDRRVLVIGRDAEGYVALYRYLSMLDVAIVLAIRGQRDAGYTRA